MVEVEVDDNVEAEKLELELELPPPWNTAILALTDEEDTFTSSVFEEDF